MSKARDYDMIPITVFAETNDDSPTQDRTVGAGHRPESQNHPLFSLDEIREILAFRERGEAPCLFVLDRIDRQLDAIDHQIAELRQLRRELLGVQSEAESLPTDDVEGKNCVCHVIQNHALQQLAQSHSETESQPARLKF
ncbi:MAG: MerR family DNA-binding protein [Anaerolineae bacterium]